MTGVAVDLRRFDAFRGAWTRGALKALEDAVRVESFRLKKVVEEELRQGVGPATQPLTREEEKTRTAAALSAFGRFVGYVVERGAEGITSKIGFAHAITRARHPEGRREQIIALLEGGGHAITRADQARIAAKLRRRYSGGHVPVLRRMGYGPAQAHRLARRSGLGRFVAPLLIPRVGTRLDWPRRDVLDQVVARERSASLENIRFQFGLKVAGLATVRA